MDLPIDLQADGLEATREGEWQLNGEVTISQGDRQLKTRDATYDPQTQTFATDKAVEYTDPDMHVEGAGAQFDPAGGATFTAAQFQMRTSASPDQPSATQASRGSAGRISLSMEGNLSLDDVRYTTCPAGNDDWTLKAADIDINQRAAIGVGRNVRLDFKGLPILYTPFISFPVGNERKSGFLFPDFGTSSRSGTALIIPWYWNIAPNYDATFSPTWFSKRGGKLDTEFRYMSEYGKSTFFGQYLPDDKVYGDSRSLVRFTDQSDFTRHLRLDIEASNASDRQWFKDFGQGPEGTSITYLDRNASLTYLSDHWYASVLAQNFQAIDLTAIDTSMLIGNNSVRPYTILPQVAMHANFPAQLLGFSFGMDAEVSNFLRDDGITGMRFDAEPQIRMPLRAAGIYFVPAASWRYTSYDLDQTGLTSDDLTPQRSAPIMSVDAGFAMERISGSKGQRLLTLEPRVMYLNVPYRDQSALPVFDTALADLNLVQLFRTNRYVGADRLSDANQLSVGITSRLLDSRSGKQFITGTVGQIYYFDPPRVALPNEIVENRDTSDIIAELAVTAFSNWNVHMGIQWDPTDTRSEKGDVHVQYRPAYNRVMNVGYRFRRSIVEQVEGSAAWPLGDQWSAYAKMVYSLEDETTLDQFAGLEYRSCCWRLRFVSRRYLFASNGVRDTDTSFMLQLELTGLSSVGVAADAFLERAIQGYSLTDSD